MMTMKTESVPSELRWNRLVPEFEKFRDLKKKMETICKEWDVCVIRA